MDSHCITNWAKTGPEREEYLYHWHYLKEGRLKCLHLSFPYNGHAGGKKAWKRNDLSPMYLQENCILHSSSEQTAKTQTGILFFSGKSVPCRQQHFWWLCFACIQYQVLTLFCWSFFFEQINVVKLLDILYVKFYSKNPYLAQMVKYVKYKTWIFKACYNLSQIPIIVFCLCRILVVGLNT